MSTDTPSLTCPKCGGTMRSVERSGVVVDVCNQCRGVFLDRGELERLIDAEGAYYSDSQGSSRGARDDSADWSDQRGGRGGSSHGQRRRGGFLGDLLDFG